MAQIKTYKDHFKEKNKKNYNDTTYKMARIEEKILINNNVPTKILNTLEKAYKNDITEQEQENIINNVYNQLFTSDMEV